LTTKLLERHQQRLEGVDMEASDGGCFEVTLGNELVYSKLKTGAFPDEDALVERIGNKLG
jgi:selT/selW/selH-like putative selenoprotein